MENKVEINEIQKALYARFAKIEQAEKITYQELKPLSRELLLYITEGDHAGDIDMINRLLNVLKPVMRRTAVEYFSHFLPYQYDKDNAKFGGKIKNKKRIAKKAEDMEKWLEAPANTIYTFKAEIDAKKPKKEVDWAGMVTKNVGYALEDEKGGLEAKAVLSAVIGGGISIEDLAAFLAEQPIEEKEAIAA